MPRGETAVQMSSNRDNQPHRIRDPNLTNAASACRYNMHLRSFGPLVGLAAVCCTGCCTPKSPTGTSRAPAPQTGAKPTQVPVEWFRTVAAEVLQAHGFVTPIAVERADSTVAVVSARTRERGDLVLAVVKMTSGRGVAVELAPYAHVGSEWPSLGRLFRAPTDQEATGIRSEIQAMLTPSTK